MKVVDEAQWQERCALLETTEEGKEFRKFLLAWMDEAERLVEWTYSPAEAQRRAFVKTEQQLSTRVSTHFLGQMLCVVAEHWDYGEQMMEGLTPIEVRLVEDSLALKIAELEEQAQQKETVDAEDSS